jgi:hypothetical protein
MVRMVLLLAFATGAALGMALGPYQGKGTGEGALFRRLLDTICAGDVLVADRYYCSYFMMAAAMRRGFQLAARLHQGRRYDFRRGRRLGPHDHLVVWQRPVRPSWMSQEEYVQMPETITVREVRVQVNRPGYRVRELVIVTTLHDVEQFSLEEIGELYHHRWHAELDIRTIKHTLGMDSLRCLTPEMVRKEIWARLCAYNLARKVAAQAGLDAGRHPRGVSLAAAQQALEASWDRLSKAEAVERVQSGRILLRVIGSQHVGNRPDRCEPRALKRRPKNQRYLNQPRAEARAELLRRRKLRA